MYLTRLRDALLLSRARKAREGREPRLEPMFVGGHNHAFVKKSKATQAPRQPLRTLFTRCAARQALSARKYAICVEPR